MKALASMLLALLVLMLGGCAQSNERSGEHYERSEKIMGTVVTLKATGNEARAAIDESFDRLNALVENVKVDVKRLNESAGSEEFVEISDDVFEMLRLSQRYGELSNGAFDVTIGAAVELWKKARKEKVLPTDEAIDDAKTHVCFNHLHLNEADRSARLDAAGVKLNLGGIGKGFGVDLVREIFDAHGIDDGLIDFGTSSIYAFGKKTIGIKNPRGADEIAETIELENAALSTSGDYEQFFIVDGRMYHHIIDPTDCMPADTGIASVTVTLDGAVENCGALADIISTTVMVLGEERGKNFLSRLPFRAEVVIIKTDSGE